MIENLILGAGLSGLSASYHIGHEKCLVLEKNPFAFGHLHSENCNGFQWDEGPHVSFTKHEYVKSLFAESVDGAFEEYDTSTTNYFRGHWITHPAQSSLHQVPEPLRSECLASFLATRNTGQRIEPINYQQWLEQAFGPVFANAFPAAYTRKYWTRHPRDMATDWVGSRVFYPKVEDVTEGARGPLNRPTHYITTVRYPTRGGFQSFVEKLTKSCRIEFGVDICRIDLKSNRVYAADGRSFQFKRLINTLPLPSFIQFCDDVPPDVKEASLNLNCTQLLLVNAIAPHPTRRKENWMYVYDEDKYSTRINCTELLSPYNAPTGWTGVQTEVYFSRHRPLEVGSRSIGEKVISELEEMGLIDAERATFHLVSVPWANVIFDLSTRQCLEVIWQWLEGRGMARESDDLDPLSSWNEPHGLPIRKSSLVMAGRFGQWKYFWTDDCILRGRALGHAFYS